MGWGQTELGKKLGRDVIDARLKPRPTFLIRFIQDRLLSETLSATDYVSIYIRFHHHLLMANLSSLIFLMIFGFLV